MADRQERILSVLNNLIEACKDREQGYRAAANTAHNQDLKVLLQSYERQSADFAVELQAEVKRLGGTPNEAGSLGGWLARGWTHVTNLVAGDDGAVIVACGHGEEAARVAYEAALGEPLPTEVRAVAERQYAAVRSGHDRLRALQAVALGPA
jgi:uncharacterized protein (TIGR02284 family)